MGRLKGTRIYLAGPIDRVSDNGVGWRNSITPFLHDLGVQVFDPCNKPISIGLENAENRKYRQILKEEGKFEELAKEIKLLRIIDLRMSDLSDFLIVYINTDIHLCGTYEELFWANRLKRPILVFCEQGIRGIPDWLFGVLPWKMFFNNLEEIKDYLQKLDNINIPVEHYKRWTFFDYDKL
jgi:hypothetical protein